MRAGAPLFARRTVGWIVAVSVVSFLLAFVMAAYGDRLTGDESPWADSYSYGALGQRALAETLERSGVEVVRRTRPYAERMGPQAPLLILDPGAGRSTGRADEVNALLDLAFDHDAAAVLALPKWAGVPDPSRTRLAVASELPVEFVRRHLDDVLDTLEVAPPNLWRLGVDRERTCRLHDSPQDAAGAGAGAGAGPEYRVDLPRLQVFRAGEGIAPVVTCGDGSLVLVADVVDIEGPPVRLIADPDLLNNHGLGRGDHAALAREVVVADLGATAVVFDETIHGHAVSESLVREALSFPIVLAVLHGLVAIGAIVWAGVGRFGTPRPPAPAYTDGKRVLIDNAAQLLSLGRHSAESLDRYLTRTVRAVATRFGMPTDRKLDALVADLQRLSDARGVEIALPAIRKRIREGIPSDDHAVRLARHLHRWRKEMTDGTGRDS